MFNSVITWFSLYCFTSAENEVTSVAANLTHLSLENDDEEKTAEEDKHLVIPDHLQVYAPECSHLSFGSFRSGTGTSVSEPYISKPSNENLEGTPSIPDATSMGHEERYILPFIGGLFNLLICGNYLFVII